MPTSAGGYLWRYCPSKSVFGQYRDLWKAHLETEQTRVPHPSKLLAISMPITGAKCHLEQTSIGSLSFVSCQLYHLFQLFNTAHNPCAALLWLPGCQCPVLCHHMEQLSGTLGYHSRQEAMNASGSRASSALPAAAPAEAMEPWLGRAGARSLGSPGERCWPWPQHWGATKGCCCALQEAPVPAATGTMRLCHCLLPLELCVAMQKSRAVGSQHMPARLGRFLPGAWTRRVQEICLPISCKPATSGEHGKALAPGTGHQAQRPGVQADSLLMNHNRQKRKATAQLEGHALPFASPLGAYFQ